MRTRMAFCGKGYRSIMNKSGLALPVLTLLFAAGHVPAAASEQSCVVVLEGQNQNRTVAGAVNVECGHPEETHTAPFGNWAVSSNYSHFLEDGNQFRGWKPVGDPPTEQHWNSCTTTEEQYRAPNCDLYNASGPEGSCRTQSSSSAVTHGRMYYRTRSWLRELLSRALPSRHRPRTTAAGSRGAR